MISQAELTQAVALIKADNWDDAHNIAQRYKDPIANWLHAILHKIEGDAGNSRYWYGRSEGVGYGDYPVLDDELDAIVKAHS
jgi:hypothetical protein